MLIAAYTMRPKMVVIVGVVSSVLAAASSLVEAVPVQTWLFSVLALIVTGCLSVMLARERLLSAQRAADADLARAKLRQFMEVISLDMRDPVFTVLGRAHLLKTQGDERQRHESVVAIEEAADLLARCSRDLIEAAAISSGQFYIEPSPFDGASLVRDVVERIRDHRITLATASDEALQVWWDRGRIEHLLFKLLENALRQSPAGGTVEVLFTRDGERAQIAVVHQGAGIAADRLPELFQPFSSPGDSVHNGRGLGLYICQAIAVAHGGDISVESTLGSGMKFVVDLPVSGLGSAASTYR